MAEQAKDKKGNKVKFIRKNGRVIPIREKGAGKGSVGKAKDRAKKKNSSLRVTPKKGSALSESSSKILKARKRGKKQGAAVGTLFGMATALAGKKTTLVGGALTTLAAGFLGAGVGISLAGNREKKIQGRRLQKKFGNPTRANIKRAASTGF